MKKYLVDSNVFLRFLLQDHSKFYQQAKKHFTQAQKGQILLVLIPEVLLEINYVLRGAYQLSRKKTAEILDNLVKSPDFEVENRETLINAIKKYEKLNVDLADIFIWETTKTKRLEILSFDKDFSRIKKTSN